MKMKIDLRVPLALPPLQVAEFISGCEKAGLSGVGMHDHQHRGRDTFMTLALAAERTSKLGLYPAVTNPLTRHPMVLAAIANTLQEIAPGRVIFPIGAGWLSAKAIGSPRATVEKLRMTVSMVQRWLAGEQVPVGSTKTRLGSVASSATPVYVAAAGPRMVGLVGEVGDGGFINVGFLPKMIAEARRLVEDGARNAGRTGQELPLIFMSPFHVDKDMATARAWGREWLMESGRQLVAWGAPYWFRAAGLDVFDHWAPEKLSDERLTQVLDAVGLFGTPEYCAKRLRYMAEEAEVNHVFLLNAHRDGPKDTSYDLPQDELDALRDVIIPMLRTLD